VEQSEKKADGKHYRFDAVLMRGDTVSSVMEVWATHETSEEKREHCLEMGYTFSEFNAQHVLDSHNTTNQGACYKLENLKIRVFLCQDCTNVNEFYNKICTGAETRILQLQESLYANYFDDVLRKREWVVMHQQGKNRAIARAVDIKNGIVKNNWTAYKADISFKCLCGKWVREDTSKPPCNRIHRYEGNEKFFDEMRSPHGSHVRKYKSDIPDDVHVKVCGLCSIECVSCNKFCLLRDAVMFGCCELCHRTPIMVNDDMSYSLQRDIARIHAGDEFRGFSDYAIEYRLMLRAQRAARKLEQENQRVQAMWKARLAEEEERLRVQHIRYQAEQPEREERQRVQRIRDQAEQLETAERKRVQHILQERAAEELEDVNKRFDALRDERDAKQQAEYAEAMRIQRVAREKKAARQLVFREKKQKTKCELREKMIHDACPEESRFLRFLLERRKQAELSDKATQVWKGKNFAAWEKNELWHQEHDRELAVAVYRQGRPNPHPDFK